MRIVIMILAFVLGWTLMSIFLSGCTVSVGQRNNEEPVITEAPTPVTQLWQAAKKSNWLVTISVLGIAGGVFALANGAGKLGTATIASASVSLFMALAVSRFALWMAVFGLIGAVAAVGFSILVRRKALIEIIKGVQKYRKGPAPIVLQTELGKQSSTTKAVVGNIKNQLKLKGAL